MAESSVVGELPHAAVLPWARHVLEVPPQADGETVRRAAAAKLFGENWSPATATRLAVEIVAVPRTTAQPLTGGSAAFCYVEAEQFQRAQVESFAEAFFRMPVADRVRQWAALWEQSAAFPAVRDRLTRLKPGLKVQLPAPDDETLRRLERLQRLITSAAAWFTTRAGQRTEERRRVDEILSEDESERVLYLKMFRGVAPQLAELTAKLFDDLPQATRKFAVPRKYLSWDETKRQHTPTLARTQTSGSSGWSRLGLGWAAIMILSNIARIGCNNTPTTREYSSPPSGSYYNSPAWQRPSSQSSDSNNLDPLRNLSEQYRSMSEEERKTVGPAIRRILDGHKPTPAAPQPPRSYNPAPNRPSSGAPNRSPNSGPSVPQPGPRR